MIRLWYFYHSRSTMRYWFFGVQFLMILPQSVMSVGVHRPRREDPSASSVLETRTTLRTADSLQTVRSQRRRRGTTFGHLKGPDGARWNGQTVPLEIAEEIGWRPPPVNLMGAGVYGGVVKRRPTGKIVVGNEWPENNKNWTEGAHNKETPTIFSASHVSANGTLVERDRKGPFLDFAAYTEENRGYTKIAQLISSGDEITLHKLLKRAGPYAKSLANLVHTGGARPLHLAAAIHGRPPTSGQSPKNVPDRIKLNHDALLRHLLANGADFNAVDNYGKTPLDRFVEFTVNAERLVEAGAKFSQDMVEIKALDAAAALIPEDWGGAEFAYLGPGEVDLVRDGYFAMDASLEDSSREASMPKLPPARLERSASPQME